MLQKIIIIFVLTLFSCVLANEDERAKHPDTGLRVPELVAKYGYPIETHQVTTEDHYILTVHRIPHGKNNANQTDKPVVFLMHGLLCSSADWVLMGPEKGLAYLLADMGYDVWMGNARGNTYSRNHVDLKPDHDKKFWKFSWHEIGMLDMPAMLDMVLEKTQVEKVFYISHSQGSTVFLVMASSLPEYNDKIKLMIGLGPAVYLGRTKNIALKIIAPFVNSVSWIAKMLGQYEFLPSNEFIRLLSAYICDEESAIQEICSNILFLIVGNDPEQLNKTMVPVILSNTPAGSATKQLIHFAQEVNSKTFAQFDYGIFNYLHYGSSEPPLYNLSKVTAPVALFSGKKDILVSPDDVEQLHSELPHSISNHKLEYENFSHLDFLWANDVVSLLYNRVFDTMERYL